MLSRRDKLLLQPWEDRRYKDHRLKVKSALPAIDCAAPAARPHVARNLKQMQRERERGARVVRDNFTLLQHLSAIMSTNRLDNHWTKPPPNFQSKVGRFYDGQRPQRTRGAADTSQLSYGNVRCFACEHNKAKAANEPDSKRQTSPSHDDDSFPFLYHKI